MTTENIECEIRSFLTPEKYDELVSYFKQNSQFLGEDNQTTYYFDGKEDLRIQKNDNYSKIWLKKGELHDEGREEVEIRCNKEDFDRLEELFLTLGYNIEIKWFRKRLSFKWEEIEVALDYTRGYGYIIELEKITSLENKDKTIEYLKQRLEELKIPLTPKEEFSKQYENYKANWQELTKVEA